MFYHIVLAHPYCAWRGGPKLQKSFVLKIATHVRKTITAYLDTCITFLYRFWLGGY
jgi:hypothetical protein